MANTIKKNFPVQGLGCAACVARVQKAISAQEGVKECNVSLASNSAQIEYDPKLITAQTIKKAVQDAGYDLTVVEDDEEDEADAEADRRRQEEYGKLKRDAIGAMILAVVIMVLGMKFVSFPGKGYVLWALATVAVFWFGRRFITTAWKQACHGTTSMDTLVALSMLISYLFSVFNLLFPDVWASRGITPHLYFESSAMIGAFILVGRTLEEKAKHGTTESIRQLMGLQPKSVNIFPGDVFTVKPGERIPADGEVVDGESYVDESMLTGEPVANLKRAGDKVYTGTMNQKGSFRVRAEKVGKDTMLSSIIRMVRDAQGSKARIQSLVDKVASIFVPVIIGISIVAFLCWAFLAPEDGITRGLLAMVTVLVIACPCSLGLATPTALIAGIGNGASKGILIKDADSLQVAGSVDTVVLDKTGTITAGHPKVISAEWHDPSYMGVLLSMELKSEHPLAMAVVAGIHEADMSVEAVPVSSFESVPGKGVKAVYDGDEFFAGAADSSDADGNTVIAFRKGDVLLAELTIADEIKENSSAAIAELGAMGIETYMLTGDNAEAAARVASKVGVKHVKAGILPQEKADFISSLQAGGHKVAMVGDGINDSAALARADLSVAMGQGSDIAMDTSMVTIVSSDLAKLPQMVELSRKTVRIIKQNLFWAFFYNILAVPIAAGVLYPINGFLLNPMIAAACMALSSVCVVTNSLRLRRS